MLGAMGVRARQATKILPQARSDKFAIARSGSASSLPPSYLAPDARRTRIALHPSSATILRRRMVMPYFQTFSLGLRLICGSNAEKSRLRL